MSRSALQLITENKKTKDTYLDLDDCGLIAVPAKVSQLVWLKSLSLRYNYGLGAQVSDFTPLADLVGLRTLVVSDTGVSDISPLAGLAALKRLDVMHTQVSDLTPLAGLVGLQTLLVSGTQVSDLAPLAGLVGLTMLHVSGTQISDLAPLEALVGLQSLDISDTQVSDLAPLASILSLETMDISGTQVRDLTPLAGLMRLKNLSVAGTQVSDLAPLAGLVNLCEFTPTVGVDKVPRRQFRALETMAEVARARKGKNLGQIAEERFQKTDEISACLSYALRLLSQHDPYPRDAPLWQHPAGWRWSTKISPNTELVLHKVDLVYKVLAASARWKAVPKEAKLQLQMGEDLPLPDYLLDRLKALSLALVRDLIATAPKVLKARGLDREDVQLLERYLDWYGLELELELFFADVVISNDLSMRSVSSLALTMRIINVLRDSEIFTVGELVRRSENNLQRMPNLGRKATNEIREALLALGLQLAGD